MGGDAGERRSDPARREQQLPAGRPVEARQLDIGQRERRRQPEHETGRPRVRKDDFRGGASAQRGPEGNGWDCGPPLAACSFILRIWAATVQALVVKATLLA